MTRDTKYVTSVVFVDDDDVTAQFEGPFPFDRDTGGWEVAIPVDKEEMGRIHPDVATNYTDRAGETLLALYHGTVVASGTIVASDVIDGELLVRADDPVYASPEDVEAIEGVE